jgi:hypothetical protein
MACSLTSLPKELTDLIMGYFDYEFIIRYSYLPLVKQYINSICNYERAYSLNNYKYLHYNDPACKIAPKIAADVDWMSLGILHRYDGPAVTSFYENGNPKLVIYYHWGAIHRKSGPAYIVYHENGVPYRQWWGRRGYTWRPDGLPNFEQYDEDGKLISTSIIYDP